MPLNVEETLYRGRSFGLISGGLGFESQSGTKIQNLYSTDELMSHDHCGGKSLYQSPQVQGDKNKASAWKNQPNRPKAHNFRSLVRAFLELIRR